MSTGAGTPLRAKLDIQAVEPAFDTHVVSTGGLLRQGAVVSGVWRARARRGPRFRVARFVRGSGERLRAFGPDVVHAIGPYGVLAALAHAARRRGTRVTA